MKTLAAYILSLAVSCAPALAAAPMSFHVATLGAQPVEVIVADGEINNGTAAELESFLAANSDGRLKPVVLLQSPGGTVVGAMQLGVEFRRIGAAVIVATDRLLSSPGDTRITPGACLASCAYALLGGRKRVVPVQSKVGVKPMVYDGPLRAPDGVVADAHVRANSQILATLTSYVRSMGVSVGFVRFSEDVPPNALHVLTPAEVFQWNIGAQTLKN